MDNKTTTNNSTNSMNPRPGERRCVFCGKAPGEQMIVGNKTYGLCQSCWQLCGQLFAHAASAEKSAKKNYQPSEIMKFLDQHVIGQRLAKKHLAVAISNHCKCINDPTGTIRRRNIMMVGPTGSLTR